MSLRSLVERNLVTYNARDWDAWIELFGEDVEVVADAGPLRGRPAVRAFAEAAAQAFPDVRAVLDRVVAETEDRIVVEYRLENALEAGRHLAGTVCAIYDVREGLIVAVRSYHVNAGDADKTDRATAIATAESRAEITRSRARMVAAEDETRRRIRRDLHDGAQQRLVQAIISLKLAKAEPAPELIDEALRHAERAMAELRVSCTASCPPP